MGRGHALSVPVAQGRLGGWVKKFPVQLHGCGTRLILDQCGACWAGTWVNRIPLNSWNLPDPQCEVGHPEDYSA